MPAVSIVIPVYNTEKYLEETMECIIGQTMRDTEIICVNDASTDNSLQILEAFADKDQRITIINNRRNHGAAVSRNIGLDKAWGTYICFLDADDIFEQDMLAKEYDAMCRYNADVAVVHTAYFKEKRNVYSMWEALWREQIVSIEKAEHNLLRDWELPPWNKMYKKKFLEDNKLVFQDLSSSNDVFFGVMSVLLAKKIVLVESSGPLVLYRTGTKTQISARRIPMNAYRAFEKVYNEMVKRELWEKYYEYFFDYFLVCILYELRCSKEGQMNRQLYEFIAQDGLKKLGLSEIEADKFKNQHVYQGIWNFLYRSYDSRWFDKWY